MEKKSVWLSGETLILANKAISKLLNENPDRKKPSYDTAIQEVLKKYVGEKI